MNIENPVHASNMDLFHRVQDAHQHGIFVVESSGNKDLMKKGSGLLTVHRIAKELRANDSAYAPYNMLEKLAYRLGMYQTLGVDL